MCVGAEGKLLFVVTDLRGWGFFFRAQQLAKRKADDLEDFSETRTARPSFPTQKPPPHAEPS